MALSRLSGTGSETREWGTLHSLATPQVRVATTQKNEPALGIAWLLRLRWGAVLAQLLAILFARFVLEAALPYRVLLLLVAFTASTNSFLASIPSAVTEGWALRLLLTADVGVLTLLLAGSGGAENPFTVFFLVHVALAAVLADARTTWSIVSFTIVSYAVLFFVPPAALPYGHGASSPGALFGMWGAYSLAACFIAHFVGRVTEAIRVRDRKLAVAASGAAQNERLASLSSFSANAAHELGTPLATILLAAQELREKLGARGDLLFLEEEAKLVCSEVVRCRTILAALSARAGESMGEMPVRVTPIEVIEDLRTSIPRELFEKMNVSFRREDCEMTSFVAPRRTLVQMLQNLVRNAFDAQVSSSSPGDVEFSIAVSEVLAFRIRDRGPGFPEEVLRKLGEPFVTTKSAEGGLGLGIYLARAFVERVGGELRVRSEVGFGALVEMSFPLAAAGVP